MAISMNGVMKMKTAFITMRKLGFTQWHRKGLCMICYKVLVAKKRRLYEIEESKKLLKEGKVSRKKTYKFWSGDYPIAD